MMIVIVFVLHHATQLNLPLWQLIFGKLILGSDVSSTWIFICLLLHIFDPSHRAYGPLLVCAGFQGSPPSQVWRSGVSHGDLEVVKKLMLGVI
jgi:hypothetical protein